MGGKSTQTQTQESTSNPWGPSQPLLNGILGQLQGQLGNTALTGTETGALNELQAKANAGNPFAPQITAFAQNLLNGGGATDQARAIQGGMDDFARRLGATADPNYSSLDDPKLKAALNQISVDVGNNVNSQFTAAGRDLSGSNQQALARGVSAAQTPLILDQYNRDRTNQQEAAKALYGAQNTTSGILSAAQQQDLANRGQGVTASGQALEASNWGANQSLAIEAQRRGIPLQALGLLASIGIPIAGLGGQKSGTSTGESTMSGAQQFATIAGGIGALMPKISIGGK